MRAVLIVAYTFYSVFRRQKIAAVILFALFASMSIRTIKHLPGRYQSSATFNFHSDFSKIPASAEFFSEIFDPNELRAEKEALLLGVLSDDFLLRIAKAFPDPGETEYKWQIQALRRDVQFIPMSRTTYQLIVEQRSGKNAQSIAQMVLSQLELNLSTERLVRMQSVASSLAQELMELTSRGEDQNMVEQLKSARVRIEEEIAQLEKKYTKEHPRLSQLRSQLSQIMRKTSAQQRASLVGRAELENWVSLRGILETRQALLQVAILMEKQSSLKHIKIVKKPELPLWPHAPKKKLLYITAILSSGVFTLAMLASFNFIRNLFLFYPNLTKLWKSFLIELNHVGAEQRKDKSGEN